MTEADIVLEQIIFAAGFSVVGLTLLFLWWYVRNTREGRVVTVLHLTSYMIVVLLTTEHIVAHLREGTSPLWQLWGAFIGFGLGIISGALMITRHGKVTSRIPGEELP